VVTYRLTCDTSSWPGYPPSKGKALPYAAMLDWTGEVRLNFAADGNADAHEIGFVNIPQFLSELDSFLRRRERA
jgi:hypothetical protein